MKPVGTIVKIDDQGRILIPKSAREAVGIVIGDSEQKYEILTEDRMLIFREHSPNCMGRGCNETKIYREHNGLRLCKKCFTALSYLKAVKP